MERTKIHLRGDGTVILGWVQSCEIRNKSEYSRFMCGFTYVYRDFSHARRLTLRVNLGGEFTETAGLGAVLRYVGISRNRAFTARKSESPIRRYRAEAALNGPVTDRRERGNIQIQNFKGQIEYLDR